VCCLHERRIQQTAKELLTMTKNMRRRRRRRQQQQQQLGYCHKHSAAANEEDTVSTMPIAREVVVEEAAAPACRPSSQQASAAAATTGPPSSAALKRNPKSRGKPVKSRIKNDIRSSGKLLRRSGGQAAKMVLRRRSLSMKRMNVMLMMLLVLTTVLFIEQALSESVSCSADSTEIGYTSIASLNADMEAELNRIVEAGDAESGQQQQQTYRFNLCANTKFDINVDGPIRPVLSNSFIMCGNDGNSANACVFKGGNAGQVIVADSTVPSYQLRTITMMGIEFTDFTNRSVSALATAPTRINFKDTKWTVSVFVCRQVGCGYCSLSVRIC